jgi:hypothetical protein
LPISEMVLQIRSEQQQHGTMWEAADHHTVALLALRKARLRLLALASVVVVFHTHLPLTWGNPELG